MKSVQAKGKSKRKNEKLSKVKLSTKDTNGTVEPDLSSLRKPIDTSVSDLYQVSKLLENGTDEVKSILSYECNVIFECRTCRSLFRSIINLISHKRVYCREKFDITLNTNILHNYNSRSSKEAIIQMYKRDETIIKNSVKNDRILRSQVSKESHKKDLSSVIDMLNKKREENMNNNSSDELKNAIFDAPSSQTIYLEPINTNHSAVYQTVKSSNTMVDTTDLMKGQVTKLHDMTDQSAPISLKRQTLKNQLKKNDGPTEIDISDEENVLLAHRLSTINLTCTICNVKFSTKKTLTVHMKTLHTSQRLCYPCPCCTSTFANSWSVYRHLCKVHRKTTEQVRKLRSHIQERAFHKETTVMEDLENACVTKASFLEDVTMKNSEKLINNIDSTLELRSCSRRKKRLNAKVALSTPSQYFQTPIAAHNETTIRQSNETLSNSTSDNNICEIEDVDAANTTIINKSDIHSKRASSSPEIYEENKTSHCVQHVSSLSTEDLEKLGKDFDSAKCNSMDNNDLHKIIPSITKNVDNSELLSSENENRDNSTNLSNTNLQSSEVACIDISEVDSLSVKIKNKDKKVSDHQSDKILLPDFKKRHMIEVQDDNSKFPSSCSLEQSEKDQSSLIEKIATIANFQKLQCLLCKRKFTSMPNLRRHMAIHVGWNRYRCKLCDFKCFVKCDCVAHCNKMHNAQNNRAVIEELIIEISPNVCNENIVMDVMNKEEEMNDTDVTDLTASLCQSETRVDLDNSNTYIPVENETAATNEQQELSKNVEDKDIAEEKDDEIAIVQNLTEYMNNGSGKLDAHPDLKRMVMEVIFGSSDTNAITQTDSDESALKNDSDTRESTNDNEGSTTSSDESREASCSISEETTLDNLKHQRPIRNRMKPLSNDFVYDLKEIAFRKKCALFNDSGPLRKKAKLCN